MVHNTSNERQPASVAGLCSCKDAARAEGLRFKNRRFHKEEGTVADGVVRLFINDHSVASGRSLSIISLAVTGAAAPSVAASAPRTTTIKFDSLARPRDTETLARTAAASAAQRARAA